MHIVSTGMVCPVGLNAESACAAMRAGISTCEELPYCDNNGEPIMGAVVPGFPVGGRNFEKRLIEMLATAVAECLTKVPDIATEKLPLLVGLAETGRPGFPSRLANNIINGLQDILEVRFHPEFSRVITSGHTSGFEALAIARQRLKHDEVSACLVCGVDSYIRAGSLLWLDQHWRLKTKENSDGVIPGEAAAAVLVCANQNTDLDMSFKLTGLGFATEPAGITTEGPLLGLGLTQAAKVALEEGGIQMHEIAFRLSDVTGESYCFREQALVVTKLLRVHRADGFPIWHCAEYIGDVGAVVGIIQLIVALHSYRKGYAPGEIVMCFTSAVSGRRAVAVLRSGASPRLEG